MTRGQDASAGDLRCPSCGETERLTGVRTGEAITVSCACGHSWQRDPRRKCPTCGGTDLVPLRRPILEKVRGTQMRLARYDVTYACQICDARKG